MSTVFLILTSFFYISGVYFLFIKRNYCGFESLPFRLLCFVISPFIVPLLFWEIVVDRFHENTNRRSSQ